MPSFRYFFLFLEVTDHTNIHFVNIMFKYLQKRDETLFLLDNNNKKKLLTRTTDEIDENGWKHPLLLCDYLQVSHHWNSYADFTSGQRRLRLILLQ